MSIVVQNELCRRRRQPVSNVDQHAAKGASLFCCFYVLVYLRHLHVCRRISSSSQFVWCIDGLAVARLSSTCRRYRLKSRFATFACSLVMFAFAYMRKAAITCEQTSARRPFFRVSRLQTRLPRSTRSSPSSSRFALLRRLFSNDDNDDAESTSRWRSGASFLTISSLVFMASERALICAAAFCARAKNLHSQIASFFSLFFFAYF